jgi:hypothetical protein
MKTLVNSSLEVLPRGRHCPFLNSKLVLISSANFRFWLRQRKNVFSGLARCVRRGEKTLQAAKLLFYGVHREIAARSTAKSSKSI